MTDDLRHAGVIASDANPTARPAGRRDEPNTNRLVGTPFGRNNADDCLSFITSPARTRPGRRVLAGLSDQLSKRDQLILTSLAELRLMSARHLERLHFREGSALTQARRSRASLARLHDLGLLTRLDRRIGGVHAGSAGFIYGLSPKGRGLLSMDGPSGGRRRQLPEPSRYFQDHVLAVAELMVRLHEATRATPLEVVKFEAEPGCWRRFTGVGGERLTLKPDAFVVTADGDYEHLSFVEADLGTEGMSTIRRKSELYRRYAASGLEQREHGVFPRVVFLAADQKRLDRLSATLRATPEGRALFVAGLLDEPVELLSGGQP